MNIAKKKIKHVKVPKTRLNNANDRVLPPLNREDPQQQFIAVLEEAGQNLRTPAYRIENGVIVID